MLAPVVRLVIEQEILWDMDEIRHYLVQDWGDLVERILLKRYLVLKISWKEFWNDLQEVRKEICTIEPKFFSIRYIQQYVFRCIILLIQGTVPKLASSGFSKFRKRNRPPSSTMPWTIWPSLVLLWGVCWMFYNPLNSDEGEQFEPLFLETDTTLDSTADPVHFELASAPFLSNYGTFNSLTENAFFPLPNSFKWPNDVDFTDFSAQGNIPGSQYTFLESSAPYAALNQEGSSPEILDIAPQHEASQINDRNPSPLTNNPIIASTAGVSTRTENLQLLSEDPSNLTQLQQPSSNTHEKLICSHNDCITKNITFPNPRAWAKHKDKHNRPFRCAVANCNRTQGFASKGDQLRHERSVHKMGMQNADTMLFCDEPNCKRGTGGVGFSRRDNFIDHVKRIHARLPTPARNAVDSMMLLDSQPLTESHQTVSSAVMIPESQRMTVTNFHTLGELSNSDGEKANTEVEKSNDEVGRSLREEALLKEVEELRQQLRKSQKEKDALIDVIGQLTQRLK